MTTVDDGNALGWAETPRGMLLFWVEVREGKLSRVKITSPSFLNWHAMPQAISGMIIPDFPLLNKSFGLSYSGWTGGASKSDSNAFRGDAETQEVNGLNRR
jgi:Ni,Fe-hydrogenase III large subunit